MKTFQTVVFVVLAFLIQRIFIVQPIDILLLLFLVDFVTLSLSTDNARCSQTPEEWHVLYLVKVAVGIGIAAVVESFGLLYFSLYILNLKNNIQQLYTFIFETLFFFGIFTVFVVRERSWIWSSRPSWTLSGICFIDSIIMIIICSFGIPFFGIVSIPIQYTFIIIGWSLVSSFINEILKNFLYHIIPKS